MEDDKTSSEAPREHVEAKAATIAAALAAAAERMVPVAGTALTKSPTRDEEAHSPTDETSRIEKE